MIFHQELIISGTYPLFDFKEVNFFLSYRAILNICFAYTSREEICTAMREVAEGVQLGLIRER